MRTLLVDPSDRGGIAAYTAMVADGLAAAGASSVWVLASVDVDAAQPDAPYIRRLPTSEWGRSGPAISFYARRLETWVRSAYAVAGAVRSTRPEIVHVQAPLNLRLDPHLLRAIRRRAAVIWTAHDVLPHEHTPGDERRVALVYRACDAVIVHSEAAADELFSLAGVRASVVAHPVPVVTAVGRDAARRELGLPGDGVLLGALGFVRPYKGYDLLADVWERIGETGPSVLVMGEQLEPGQTDVLQRLGRAPRAIVRLGYVEHRELALAVEACDAVLLPYVGGSDSGILHLARSLRTPTIASDSPQLASSVLANRCGTVVPRDPEAWLAAVTGELPAAPAPAPAPSATGQAHLRVYATALRSRGGR